MAPQDLRRRDPGRAPHPTQGPVLRAVRHSVAVFLWILYQGDTPGAAEESLLFAVFTVAAYKKPGWGVAAIALAILSWSPIPARHLCFCLVHIGTFAIIATIAGVAMRGGR